MLRGGRVLIYAGYERYERNILEFGFTRFSQDTGARIM